MKRFLCIILSAVLLLSAFALTAFSVDTANAGTENKGYTVPDPDDVLDDALARLEDAGVLEISDDGDVILACGDEVVTFAGNLKRKIKDAVDAFLASDEYAKIKAESDVIIEDGQVRSIFDSILSCWKSLVDNVVVILNDDDKRAELERRLSDGCAFIHKYADEIRDELQAKIESGELTVPGAPGTDVIVDADGWDDFGDKIGNKWEGIGDEWEKFGENVGNDWEIAGDEWENFGEKIGDFFEDLFDKAGTQAPAENG